jgi:hypothetical protein
MKKNPAHIVLLFLLSVSLCKATAQTSISISLKVNQETEAAVFHNEPVLFDVMVTNQAAQADERWNMAADRRLDEMKELLGNGQLKQDDYDKEKMAIEKNKRKTGAVTLGSASSSWVTTISWRVMNTANREEVQLPVKLMKKPETSGIAVLDANAVYMACYGINPEDLKSVAPGTYAIELSVNNILSNAVLLKVAGAMMDGPLANSEPMLLRLGEYYWHEEDAVNTMLYADKLLAKNPSSLDGLSLKGDGQVLQKSYLPALETYNKAVKEYYKQNGAGSEPPEYLFSMIAFVKKEMGQ